ncbi:MAG: hypothetical protein KatS3mg091_132 [Patescibacteria group bacterium]|nr:MAG: hypothetical protein KatS3mg091_132 [Patescibacteria group bacterium]
MANFSIVNDGTTVAELKDKLINFLYEWDLYPEGQINRGQERK